MTHERAAITVRRHAGRQEHRSLPIEDAIRIDATGSTYYAGGGTFELWVPATTTLNSTVAADSPLNQFPWRNYPVGTLARTYYFVGSRRAALRETSALTTTAVYRYGNTGELISVVERDAAKMQTLQSFVDNGTAEWLK